MKMRRALVLATATRAARFGGRRILAPVGLIGGASLLSGVRARKQMDYNALTGLPESWAAEAARHALAGEAPARSAGGYDIATFAGGCFWGVELRFQRVPGVIATCSGYVQGREEKPTYKEVSARETSHTEAVQLIFDPGVVSYADLLDIFWDRLGTDATRANGVGNDRGPQYRAGVYALSDTQLAAAEASLTKRQARFAAPIATEVEAQLGVFWPAEEYHQQYLKKGGQSAKKKETETIRCYG